MKKLLKAVAVIIVVLVLAAAFLSFRNKNADIITRDDAIKIAMEKSNLSEDDVVKTKVELDKDLFTFYYEVELEDSTTEYEYKIDALTGKVISFKSEPAD